ncbi:general transcription factor II-I repeat domain-containing protein 2B-like [Onthophagus taurus]|uniref:general transcription factor II-I repeat domain-containing protein 2B-like n=1 Tax=Onthophagus taurus TaxID=166361 RepID=UPI0039BEB0E4
MDESTDVSDTSQLLVFVRGVDDDLNVTQELASVNSMHGTTTGADIFKELQQTLTKYNLDWNRLQGVTIDGGRNMSGTNIGVVGLIRKACESAGATVPIFLHCIIHQQALCVKHVDMSCVLKPVVSVVNFIRSRALNHRQFRSFLEEIESETVDLSYYTAVRWLSCGKVLLQFFKLRKEIKIFLAEKNHPETLLSDAEWLWKLAIFADVVTHVNNLNLKLQCKNNLICDLFEQINAFRAKLILLKSHMNECNFSHFTCCEKFSTETDERFPTIFAVKVIADLKLEFQKRFSDFDINSREIRLFQNPYDCNVGDVSSQFQMEIIDLQASDQIKNKYKEGNLIDFYKFLDAKEFPNLKQLAGQAAKGKWKNLKDKFRVELHKIPKKRSGSENDNYKSKWPFFDMMLFVKDSMLPSTTTGNLLKAPENTRRRLQENYTNLQLYGNENFDQVRSQPRLHTNSGENETVGKGSQYQPISQCDENYSMFRLDP